MNCQEGGPTPCGGNVSQFSGACFGSLLQRSHVIFFLSAVAAKQMLVIALAVQGSLRMDKEDIARAAVRSSMMQVEIRLEKNLQ